MIQGLLKIDFLNFLSSCFGLASLMMKARRNGVSYFSPGICGVDPSIGRLMEMEGKDWPVEHAPDTATDRHEREAANYGIATSVRYLQDCRGHTVYDDESAISQKQGDTGILTR